MQLSLEGIALEAAIRVLAKSFGASTLGIFSALNEAGSSVAEVAGNAGKNVDDLKSEVEKQNLRMNFESHKAKVAQELAIALRIETAEEVEIEEFYDKSGKGHAGLTGDAIAKTASFGVGAEGHFVTKRIYRFKGARSLEKIEKSLSDMIEADETAKSGDGSSA